MANSIQTVGQSSAHFNDLDLIAVAYIMIDEVQQNPETYAPLAILANEWTQTLVNHGPGTIDMNLDHIASSHESTSCFCKLLLAVDTSLRQFGNIVPSSLLNRQRLAPGVSFTDYPYNPLAKKKQSTACESLFLARKRNLLA
ncbi:hypothetical protein WMF38_07500 [Sorangium sp. So ce118]